MNTKIQDKIIRYYEWTMYTELDTRYFQGSDYGNCGHWPEGTSSPKAASESLLEKLLGFVTNSGSTVLDVACGKGATTRFLARRLAYASLSGINISTKQLDTAKTNAPECSFGVMDAASLGFRNQSFDTVICVEAAFHFDTRALFLQEAYRVLNVGGHLVMSDILYYAWVVRASQLLPKDNYLRDAKQYRELLQKVGFQDIRIVDATDECWRRFLKYIARWSINGYSEKKISLRNLVRLIIYVLLGFLTVKSYVLISAKRE